MSKSILKKLPKSTYELTIAIPWSKVKESYEKVFDNLVKQVEVPGFRKGKAPKKLVEEKVDKKPIYESVIKEIVPVAYSNAIKEHNLIPIVSPKIEVVEAKENKSWIFKATCAGKPKINLKNYKQRIKSVKQLTPKIWTPAKAQEDKEKKKLSLDDVINILLEEVEVELSDFLIEQEENRLLVSLIDQTQKLGLTIEQYLIAKGKTQDQIKSDYRKQAEKNLKVEFVLAEIANLENITVTQQDIDQLIAKVKDDRERNKFKQNSYYLAHLIRQQKTLDFLHNL